MRASGHFLPTTWCRSHCYWGGRGVLAGWRSSDPCSPCPASFAMRCLPQVARWRVAGPWVWGVGCVAAACSDLAGLQSWFCFSSALSQGRFCGLGGLTDKARPSPLGMWLGFSARSRASYGAGCRPGLALCGSIAATPSSPRGPSTAGCAAACSSAQLPLLHLGPRLGAPQPGLPAHRVERVP